MGDSRIGPPRDGGGPASIGHPWPAGRSLGTVGACPCHRGHTGGPTQPVGPSSAPGPDRRIERRGPRPWVGGVPPRAIGFVTPTGTVAPNLYGSRESRRGSILGPSKRCKCLFRIGGRSRRWPRCSGASRADGSRPGEQVPGGSRHGWRGLVVGQHGQHDGVVFGDSASRTADGGPTAGQVGGMHGDRAGPYVPGEHG